MLPSQKVQLNGSHWVRYNECQTPWDPQPSERKPLRHRSVVDIVSH